MPPSSDVREHLPRSSPEHEKRDELGDPSCLGQIAPAERDSELGAVAAHEGNEQAAEMLVPDRVDHTGERRQQRRHDEQKSLANEIAVAARLPAGGSRRLSHALENPSYLPVLALCRVSRLLMDARCRADAA